jgi:type II secretory pathway component GspD/PulD (secretin)
MSPRFLRAGFIPALVLVALASPALAQWRTEQAACQCCVETHVSGLDDQELAIEVRFLSATPELAQRLLKHCTPKGKAPASLDDKQLFALMEAAQGDRHTSVMQAPRVTLFSGQCSTLCIEDSQQYVTGLDVSVKDGHVVAMPKTEVLPCGVQVSLQPVISADRRMVRMNLRAVLKDVDTTAPLLPVMLPVMPEGADAKTKPLQFTQYLQQPKARALVVDKNFAVADGHTMILNAGTRVREVYEECPQPILSEIPFLCSLFRVERHCQEPEQVLMLVTPRIIVTPEEEKKPPLVRCSAAEPVCCRKVQALLEQYKALCAAGHLAEARDCAIKALTLDPACFTKKP